MNDTGLREVLETTPHRESLINRDLASADRALVPTGKVQAGQLVNTER